MKVYAPPVSVPDAQYQTTLQMPQSDSTPLKNIKNCKNKTVLLKRVYNIDKKSDRQKMSIILMEEICFFLGTHGLQGASLLMFDQVCDQNPVSELETKTKVQFWYRSLYFFVKLFPYS